MASRNNLANEMKKLKEKLPAMVRDWVAMCEQAWSMYLIGGDGDVDADSFLERSDVKTVKLLCDPERFASVPPNESCLWAGLCLDVAAGETEENKSAFTYIVKQEPEAAIVQVDASATHVSLVSRLRVVGSFGTNSSRFLIAVIFSHSQLGMVQQVVTSLFPQSSPVLAVVSELPDDEAPTSKNAIRHRNPHDNLRMIYYCKSVVESEDNNDIFQTSVLRSRVSYFPTQLGWSVLPAEKSRPDFVKGELNLLLPFQLW